MMHPARQAYVEEDDPEVSTRPCAFLFKKCSCEYQSAACFRLRVLAWGDGEDPG